MNSAASIEYVTIRPQNPFGMLGGISRMHFLVLVSLLLGTLTWGQQITPRPTVPPESRPALTDNDDQEAPASASKIAPDAPVLTIRGLCAQTPSTKNASNQTCETIITRAQFENLADAILTN